LASPLYADVRGLPPMYIAVGEYEMLVDDSKLLAENARAAGIEVEIEIAAEMQHVYTSWGLLLPEARNTIDSIGAFIRRHAPIT
jgi:acetyl esterase/lipase